MESLKEKESTSTTFVVLLLTIPSAIYSGFVFSKLWQWFISGTFGVQQLRVVEAIGIMMTVGFIKASAKKPKEDESSVEALVYALTYISIAWGMGAIVSRFM